MPPRRYDEPVTIKFEVTDYDGKNTLFNANQKQLDFRLATKDQTSGKWVELPCRITSKIHQACKCDGTGAETFTFDFPLVRSRLPVLYIFSQRQVKLKSSRAVGARSAAAPAAGPRRLRPVVGRFNTCCVTLERSRPGQ